MSLQNLRLEQKAAEKESLARLHPHSFDDRDSKRAAQALEMLPVFTEKSKTTNSISLSFLRPKYPR